MANLPKTEKCPYCGAERQIPMYAYAHWNDLFTVTCENKACGKTYSFFQGTTAEIVQRKKSKAELAGKDSGDSGEYGRHAGNDSTRAWL
jgi:hypothetical protein